MNLGYEVPGQTVTYVGPNGRPPRSHADYERMVETATARSSAALLADGRKLLIIEPIPRAPVNPITCLSKAKVLQECRYDSSAKPDWLERY